LNSDLQTLETSLAEAREKMRQQNALLATFALDELQANQAHWRTLLSVSQRSLNESQRRMQERQQACSRQTQNMGRIKDEQARLAETINTLGTQQTGLHEEELLLSQKLSQFQIQIDPSEAELSDVEAQLTAMEKDEAASRQALNQAEHLNAQARINLARQQESLDSLRRRIEDDFGLVAFEYVEQVSGPTPLPLEGMVEQLPKVAKLSAEVEEAIKRQRAQLRRIGAINPEAQSEYQEVKGRFEFMNEQVLDLQQAEDDVRQVIAELDQIMEQELLRTFEAVAIEFKQIFTRLFGGGAARLVLTDPDDLTNTGIDIEARLPGRRTQGLSLLSGGERSLTATALIFSLLKVSPTPFCVLDEVDAMLDEANVGRFRELLRELSINTQFVIVTHNRNTVQVADVIYGVTMGRDSASQVLSLKLDEVSQVVTEA
jgi:chromosome segregation protein